MVNNLKAELRKLYSIRSTYIMPLLCLSLALLFAFYGVGFHSAEGDLHNPFLLTQSIINGVGFLAMIGTVVAVLLVAHEYRYNFISYTLTASKTRSQVLPAKLLAATTYALLFTVLFAVAIPLLAAAGLHANGSHYITQSIPYASLTWRVLFTGWGYFMLGMTIALLVRNLIGAVVTALVFPAIVSNLLTLAFRGNSKYLPYHALNNVLSPHTMSSGKAAIVVAVYIVVGWVVAWVLFVKRDAS